MITLLESVARRDFPLKVKERLLQAGFVFLVLLMATVLSFDVLPNVIYDAVPETSPAASAPAAARRRRATIPVAVGKVMVGGGAPVVVQSMTNTDTADATATARQCRELAEAGSELVRVTVNIAEAAAAVPESASAS